MEIISFLAAPFVAIGHVITFLARVLGNLVLSVPGVPRPADATLAGPAVTLAPVLTGRFVERLFGGDVSLRPLVAVKLTGLTVRQLSDPLVRGDDYLGTAGMPTWLWLSMHPTFLAVSKVVAVVSPRRGLSHLVGSY